MAQENENRRPEINFTLKELGGLLVFIGSMVSAWVSLNNSQVETDTKLSAFEKYYTDSSLQYRQANEKTLIDLKVLISEQKKSNKELGEQVNDLERSVTQIYRLSTRKK